ncbi:hypothetical protein NFI95_06070 [Acetobacteraceae bacterium KSS8]|uniref:Uncharacterized protein n=1 Tax=Endosaccharibacter trunci TaxID=2812733 RepID=A0ABT1W6H2_9PROT|nr:hypothetical protein [Acetobacteraceae bacterium KSS8]
MRRRRSEQPVAERRHGHAGDDRQDTAPSRLQQTRSAERPGLVCATLLKSRRVTCVL